MRPKGSSAQLEQRRRDALAMLRRGVKPPAGAPPVRGSLGSGRPPPPGARRWGGSVVAVGRGGGAAGGGGGARALAARRVPGRPPKLGAARRRRLLDLLRQGPARHGFRTELWTLGRVAEVIERRFGVRYHPSQVWRILSGLGWSCQKPESRARERDEGAIERWRRATWPRIKKTRRLPAGACCSSTRPA